MSIAGASDVGPAVAAVDRRRRRLRRRRMAERRQRVARRTVAGAGADRLDLLVPAGGEPRRAAGSAGRGAGPVGSRRPASARWSAWPGPMPTRGSGLRDVGEPYDGRPVARIPELRIEFPRVLDHRARPAPHRQRRQPTPPRRWPRSGRAAWCRCSTRWRARAGWTSRRRTPPGRCEQGGGPRRNGAVTLARARDERRRRPAAAATRRARDRRAATRPRRWSSSSPPSPATYRVEVSLPTAPGQPPVPWLVSNAIYVGRPAGGAVVRAGASRMAGAPACRCTRTGTTERLDDRAQRARRRARVGGQGRQREPS